MRVADNMRNVAVTDGDKVEAQIKFGWEVDAYPVNEIVEAVALAALYWRKATNAGIIASIVSGFVVSIGWDLIGKPWGLGSAVPGSLVCAVVLVTVSLATYKTHPSEMV